MVRIAVIGLGNRARKYLRCLSLESGKSRVVAAVEPDGLRRARAVAEYGSSIGEVFASAEELFASDVAADAVIVASPDGTHYPFAMAALERGWNVLLEKPVAGNLHDCLAIEKEAAARGLTVSVCYVLRFHPLYRRLKEIAEDGSLRRLLSVRHRLNVGIDRMTHTFVRGLWSKESSSSPIILSKASHDIDILCWIAGGRPVSVYSEGSLGLFTSASAPEGSALRCCDCPLENSCRFSAVDLYLRRDEWNKGFDILPGETKDDAVLRELRTGRYGRCVFRCDNDVLDRQSVRIAMDNGVEISLDLDGRTDQDSRETAMLFERGTIRTEGTEVIVRHFGGEAEKYDLSESCSAPLHAGADAAVVSDFLRALRGEDRLRGADISSSIISHQLCFAAEESRRLGSAVFL